jgi:two-component system CheB/CheR fusion protein
MPLKQKPASIAFEDVNPEEGRIRGMKLLLVYDSPDILETFSMILEIEAAKMQGFCDPCQAIEAARHSSFDLIAADIGMPGMDGYALLEALRATPHLQSTPSMALTCYGGDANDQSHGAMGFLSFLQKTIPVQQLVEAPSPEHRPRAVEI